VRGLRQAGRAPHGLQAVPQQAVLRPHLPAAALEQPDGPAQPPVRVGGGGGILLGSRGSQRRRQLARRCGGDGGGGGSDQGAGGG
jgi:hypothetical protein